MSTVGDRSTNQNGSRK